MTVVLVHLFSLSMLYWLIDYRGMLNTYLLAHQYQSYETVCYLVSDRISEEKKMQSHYEVNQYRIVVSQRGDDYLMEIYNKKGRELYRWHCAAKWAQKER